MILYGMRPSPFVRKVLLFAAEKGIALDLQPAGLGRGNDIFEKASPFGKMPGFADADFAISDSSAIVHYLDAQYPEPALIPAEPRARARTIWYDEFADTILFATGGKLFWNRIVAPKFMKVPSDAAVADAAERDELPRLFTYLESVIPDSGFLVEDRLTLADIAVASPFINLAYCCPPVDKALYPRICSWLSAMKARPAFAAVLEAEKPMIEGMADRPELVV
ncbi:glutathione S-transferase family protein [Sphingobium algorifonticola]|uniref:Glutathione S-transferase family protein n=1 Tax=Sphingobium algorifonticola TaxID=2008318 RepID=A0A437JC40_9SPHN|nr:glutathione S-transferase family protein [Sphingobium algorifonticola]RVT43441.1 glutathione S-transferase family protein [Sphingobium algorifonticola]